MKFKTPLKTRYDQNLVADQPGRPIFFSGFFLALILGLLFRGLTAPQKVQTFVSEAASRIHKNIDVRFESAEISLSHRGFPRLSVVIHNVEMSSVLTCWGQPHLVAKEIILPFSLISMVFEHQPFKKILATEVDLRFRSKYVPCAVAIETSEKNNSKKEAITLVNRRKDMDLSVSPTMDRLEIDQLRLQFDQAPESAIEMVDLTLQVKSQQPKAILLQASTELMNSRGQVVIDYKEFPEHELAAHFFGNWREGNYSFDAEYKFADTSLTTDAELKRIPAVPVIAALKNYGWLREDLDGRKIWVTMKGHSQGFVNAWEKTPLFLKDVRIEGDLGEIEIDEFKAQQLKPFVFKPMQAKVKNLKADLFLGFLKKPQPFSFLGRLGEFNGRLELISPAEVSLRGQQTGLEFIFSNRGQRQIQKLTSFDGEIKLRQNQWDFLVKNIIFDQGQFDGDLKLTADRDLKKINLQLSAENLRLSAPVQRLMTGVDQKANMKAQLQMQMKEGKWDRVSGFIRSPDLTIDQLHFEKLNSQFEMKNEILGFQLTAQAFQVRPTSKAFELLTQMIGKSEDIFQFKQLNGHFDLTPANEFYWKNLSAQMEASNLKLSSEGQWDAKGFLNGKILLSGKTPTPKWLLLGHRDQPQVSVEP